MPVYSCCGWSCRRMISVSSVPGGNPVALRDPEHFAVDHRTCEDCKQTFCDRCIARKSRRFTRPRCHSCRGRLLEGFQQVRTRPWPDAVVHYNRAHELARAGAPGDALAAFDRALQLRSDYVSAHHWRGIVLHELGRGDEALAALDRATRLDPGHLQALFDAAGILRDLGRPDESLRALDRALAAEPRYVGAHVNRAITLRVLGRFADALAASEEAVRIQEGGRAADDTPHVLAYAYGAKATALMSLGRFDDALAALDVAVDSGPDDPHHYRNRAVVLDRLGRHDEARVDRRLAEELRGET